MRSDGSGVVDPLTSDSFTHAAANDLTEKPFTVRLDEAHPKGVLLYHAANNGVPVLIQKVDAAGKQVPDASFALYKGSLEAQPEELVREGAAGTYRPAQDLDPGTYYVVNTNAGAHAGQQLPFPFEFTVANGNGVMSLADRTQASGLIQLFTPEGANASGGEQSITATGKWTIQLADVSVGELPHSGGWRPWVIAAGVALLLAALIRMNRKQ
ncbi:SpaA isopeptide-forming pilin-related protein [Actinotignum sp. GS-2025b]|uniref:SpaA isopeptide-forming pilin-related protein n=1 Tax=Actinotignum sp. GS-2025b TaxID=3427275 RepID=UPI003F465718